MMQDIKFLERMHRDSLLEEESKREQEQARAEAEKEQEREPLDEAELAEQAEEMLREASYTLLRGSEKAIEERDALGEQGLSLSKEYKRKKAEIEDNPELTDLAKGRRLDALFLDYEKRMKALIAEQNKVDRKYHAERKKMAERSLADANEKASLDHFTEKEMQYILFVAENGNKQSLAELLKQFDFNPFLIRLLNMKNEKKPASERLNWVHPLELLVKQTPERSIHALRVPLGSGLRLPKTLEELIPSQNVPLRDEWSMYREEPEKWGDA